MSKDIIQMLSDGIDMVAKKLGVAVDKIYPILMNQAKYDFYKDIVWLSIGMLSIVLSIFLIVFFFKKYGDMFEYDSDLTAVLWFVVIVLISIGASLSIINITEMIQIKVNPEWFIFNEYIKPLITK